MKILGSLMRPCSLSQEDNEKIWKSSEFYTEQHFLSEYQRHMIAMEHITECAKIFILKNWEKVQSWEELNVKIDDNSGKSTEYYNYVPRKKRHVSGKGTLKKFLEKMESDDRKRHNPIKTVSNVVLDTTDGDFSLTINGKPHLWIDDEAVILIADYIEKCLNKND